MTAEDSIDLACQVGNTLAETDDLAQMYTDSAAALASKDSDIALAAIGVAKALVHYRETIRKKAEAQNVRPVKVAGRYLSATARHDLREQFGISESALVAGGRLTYRLGERKSVALIMSLLIERGLIKE